MSAKLKIVADLGDEIRLALTQHSQALEAIRWAEDELKALGRRYAAERGEFMLPTIERLRREFAEG